MTESPLLHQFTAIFSSSPNKRVLDLACGSGRNGLFLALQGYELTFADKNADALDSIQAYSNAHSLNVHCWQVDLESGIENPLEDKQFDAILVFRYLHRPLIPAILAAIKPGGILCYETFTLEQPRFGRPTNPHFLLNPGELQSWVKNWESYHFFEGIESDKSGQSQAVSRIICRKPSSHIGDCDNV